MIDDDLTELSATELLSIIDSTKDDERAIELQMKFLELSDLEDIDVNDEKAINDFDIKADELSEELVIPGRRSMKLT